MLSTKFQFIWESGFRGEDFFRNEPIKNKNGLWRPCLSTINKHGCHMQFLFLIGRFLKSSPLKPHGQMNRNLVGSIYGRSSIKIAHFVPIRWLFRNWPIWNKNCLWQPCLLTNQDEMSNLYRGPSIDASYHLVGRSSINIAHLVPIR
jgi:hypothetical protein